MVCCCLLPVCTVCFPQAQHDSSVGGRNSGSGQKLSEEFSRLVRTVDEALAQILNGSGPQYLRVGPDWDSLPTFASSKGSRHDNLIAFLFNCGVQAVRTARARFLAPHSAPIADCSDSDLDDLVSCSGSEMEGIADCSDSDLDALLSCSGTQTEGTFELSSVICLE